MPKGLVKHTSVCVLADNGGSDIINGLIHWWIKIWNRLLRSDGRLRSGAWIEVCWGVSLKGLVLSHYFSLLSGLYELSNFSVLMFCPPHGPETADSPPD